MTSEPGLAICLGVPKAGTSWLQQSFRSHPEIHVKAHKESRYFTYRHDPASREGIRVGIAQRRADLSTRPRKQRRRAKQLPTIRPSEREMRDLAALERLLDGDGADLEGYLAYLTDGAARARQVVDVSPEYCRLPKVALVEMVDLGARFILLLRDPLDRLWSHVRMMAHRRAARHDLQPQRCAERILERFLEGGEQDLHAFSDYKTILNNVAEVVPPGRVHIAFYETLFTDTAAREVTRFLGVAPHSVDAERRVLPGKPLPLPASSRRALLDRLAPQYDYAFARFGGQLPERWLAHQRMAHAPRPLQAAE